MGRRFGGPEGPPYVIAMAALKGPPYMAALKGPPYMAGLWVGALRGGRRYTLRS